MHLSWGSKSMMPVKFNSIHPSDGTEKIKNIMSIVKSGISDSAYYEKELRIAIGNKNCEQIERIIREAGSEVCEKLCNPIYLNQTSWRKYKHGQTCLMQTPPILFESVFQGKDVFETLLKFGANVLVTDQQGWNIIHYLVVASHNFPHFEDDAVSVYKWLKYDISKKELNSLLMHEDYEELRPLEMAIHLSCICMFDAIFNTRDIYLIKKEKHGFYDTFEYDISEYESTDFKRWGKSPLLLLHYLDKRILTNEKAVQILVKGPLKDWVLAKLYSNFPFVMIWALLRLAVSLGFLLLISVNVPWDILFDEVIGRNGESTDALLITAANKSTCEKPPIDWYNGYEHLQLTLLALFYMFFYSAIAILYDLVEFSISIYQNWARWRKAFGRPKNLVASTYYYRGCQFLFSVMSILWTILYMRHPTSLLTDVGLIFTVFFSTWSVLYFVQIIPFIGKFVNSIQEMLTVMAQFIVVYVIILIPFPHTFQVLLRGEDQCKSVKEFETLGMGFYSSFRIMLNMLDLTSYDVPGVTIAYVLHIVFVFFVSILLVNFLIALMSSSVGEVVDAGEAIMIIQRLSVGMLLEWRLHRPLCLLYRLQHRRFFLVKGKQIHLEHKHLVLNINTNER